jgi:hypothetical protein
LSYTYKPVDDVLKMPLRAVHDSTGGSIKIKTILDSFERVCLKKYGRQVKFIANSSNPPRGDYKSPPETLDDLSFRENYDWQPLVNIKQGILLTLQ